MNRIIKFSVLFFAGIIALVVIAAAVLPKVIDPNDYRADISKTVYDSTGMHLTIDGPIEWSIFPWLGLSLEQVNIKDHNDANLMELDTAEVSVKLVPLLRKTIEMQSINVKGLRLNLVKEKNSKGNWQFDKPSPQVSATTNNDANAPATDSSTSKALTIDIASVMVEGLVISYLDRTSGAHYIIDQASLTTGEIRNKTPFNFKLMARVKNTEPELTLQTQLSGSFQFNLEKGNYKLNNISLSATPASANAETLLLIGSFDIQQTPLFIKGQLDVSQFDPSRLLNEINVALPPMAGPKAMSKLAFKSHFILDEQQFSADKLELTLDDFSINGYFKVTDLKSQAMVFQFNGNDLNLDHYLPPGTEAEPEESTNETSRQSTSNSTKETPLIPEDLLRPLNIKGGMELQSLTVANLHFNKPSLKISAQNGRDNVTINSGFYEGTISAISNLNVRHPGKPVVTKDIELKGINLKAMAQAIPALESIEGTVNGNIDLETSGLYQTQLTKNLDGNANFSISEGAFTKANFDKMVCEGIATIRKKELKKTDWGSVTKFTHLGGSFTITNGVAYNKDLAATLSKLNLKGDGEINLVQKTLDYHVGLNISGDRGALDSDPACEVNEDYRDVTWPVRCKGELGKQHCGIDQQRLAQTVGNLLKKEAQKRIKKEIEKKTGPLKETLKGFFK